MTKAAYKYEFREGTDLRDVEAVDRAIAAAADEQHRAAQVALDHPRHLGGELRIDFPIRPLLPGDMLGTGRMADVHVLDFRPAIDQNGLRVVVQKIVGGLGVEMLHRHIRKLVRSNIMKASRRRRKLGFHPQPEFA